MQTNTMLFFGYNITNLRETVNMVCCGWFKIYWSVCLSDENNISSTILCSRTHRRWYFFWYIWIGIVLQKWMENNSNENDEKKNCIIKEYMHNGWKLNEILTKYNGIL